MFRLFSLKNVKLFFIIFLLFLFFSPGTLANNATIQNFGPSGLNTTTGLMSFTAQLSWDNAWRSDFNHDALWVFLKVYRTDLDQWNHLRISESGLNPSSITISGSKVNYEVLVPEDRTGFFLRLSPGQSQASVRQSASAIVTFKWKYAESGITDFSTAVFKLFAIEMVYIPEGSFLAGDATTASTGSYAGFRYAQASTANNPTVVTLSGWPIRSEQAITTHNIGNMTHPGEGPYYYYTSNDSSGENATGDTFTIPSEFPKGYKAFYLMKHEISQNLYAAFLNTLPLGSTVGCAATVSVPPAGKYCDSAATTAPVNRQFIKYVSATQYPMYGADANDNDTLDESTDGGWVAMNFLSWPDLARFLDWAALRPMTELEFEKASRGPIDSVVNEYVWGDTSTAKAPGSLSNSSQTSELGNMGNANFASSLTGPIRVGAFGAYASTAGQTRAIAGAGYYGNLDLGGNVWEMTVSVGLKEGRAFQGSHGDGFLTANEAQLYAENLDWPGNSGAGVVGTAGIGKRGGSWYDGAVSMYTSDRLTASQGADLINRQNHVGGRGARTAPTFAAASSQNK